jgi:hypothetical protein
VGSKPKGFSAEALIFGGSTKGEKAPVEGEKPTAEGETPLAETPLAEGEKDSCTASDGCVQNEEDAPKERANDPPKVPI